MATITSPARMPASAAGPPGLTSRTRAPRCRRVSSCTPMIARPVLDVGIDPLYQRAAQLRRTAARPRVPPPRAALRASSSCASSSAVVGRSSRRCGARRRAARSAAPAERAARPPAGGGRKQRRQGEPASSAANRKWSSRIAPRRVTGSRRPASRRSAPARACRRAAGARCCRASSRCGGGALEARGAQQVIDLRDTVLEPQSRRRAYPAAPPPARSAGLRASAHRARRRSRACGCSGAPRPAAGAAPRGGGASGGALKRIDSASDAERRITAASQRRGHRPGGGAARAALSRAPLKLLERVRRRGFRGQFAQQRASPALRWI